MSGHSKWAQIKRQKGVTDSRRGQLFTKLGREIVVAARQGGPSPEANFRLRLAVQKARDANMPIDSIDRAIKRAAGAAEGASFAEVNYEGYGPGGAAILVQVLTDNRNRTISEIRNVFVRNGGNMGESGSVTWLFEPKGVITVEANDAEELELYFIDAGAEDIRVIDGTMEIHTKPTDLEALRKAAAEKKLKIASADLVMMPKNTVMLDEKSALQILKLLDRLEELDEVQKVYTNADFPDSALEKYRSQA